MVRNVVPVPPCAASDVSAESVQEVSDVGSEPVGHLDEGHVTDVVVHLQPAGRDRLLRGEEVAQRYMTVAVPTDEKAREPEAAEVVVAVEVAHRARRPLDVLGCGAGDDGEQGLELVLTGRTAERGSSELTLLRGRRVRQRVERSGVGQEVEAGRRRRGHEYERAQAILVNQRRLQAVAPPRL